MRKIRVLVVDDSVVIRRLLVDVLGNDPDIEVAGTAPTGRIALSKLTQLNPDVVTLDIEMPELDGLQTLPELRKSFPRLPVIMFSTLTERGAVATLDALALGATDYVTKPANVGSVAAAMQSVKDQLIPKIKSLGRPLGTSSAASVRKDSTQQSTMLPRAARSPQQRTDIVVIGCSTGGPQALTAVLSELPADFPAPIVVVQHMPPVFTKHLASRLNQQCSLEVAEAQQGDKVIAGRVLIAPGDFHLELVRSGVSVTGRLQQGPPENSCRPAVDVLFRSAGNLFGAGCLAVVMTGMGHDGLNGSQLIVQQGGTIIAQDEATSVVWGMPGSVVEAGLATATLPLSMISTELVRCASLGRRVGVLT